MKWFVFLKKYSDESITRTFGPYSNERQAEKVDSGLNMNLNHEEYYSVIREAEVTTQDKEGS